MKTQYCTKLNPKLRLAHGRNRSRLQRDLVFGGVRWTNGLQAAATLVGALLLASSCAHAATVGNSGTGGTHRLHQEEMPLTDSSEASIVKVDLERPIATSAAVAIEPVSVLELADPGTLGEAASNARLQPSPTTPGSLNPEDSRPETDPAVQPVNIPPRLLPIPDQTIHAGMTLTLGIDAYDPDHSKGALAFSLDPGAPDGAVIHPATGSLFWRTTELDAGVRSLNVRVTDSAEPAASAVQTILVNVVAPLRILYIQSIGDQVALAWNAIPGKRYLVELASSVVDPIWYQSAVVAAETELVHWQQTVPLAEADLFYTVSMLEDAHCACEDIQFHTTKPDVDTAKFDVKTRRDNDRTVRGTGVEVQIPFSVRGLLNCETSPHEALKCEGTVEIHRVNSVWQFSKNPGGAAVGNAIQDTPREPELFKRLTVQNNCNSQGTWIPLKVNYTTTVSAGDLSRGQRESLAEGKLHLRGSVEFRVRWKCALAGWQERNVKIAVDSRADENGGGVNRQGHFDFVESDFDGDGFTGGGADPDDQPYDPDNH